jgi:hypothetical protein
MSLSPDINGNFLGDLPCSDDHTSTGRSKDEKRGEATMKPVEAGRTARLKSPGRRRFEPREQAAGWASQ